MRWEPDPFILYESGGPTTRWASIVKERGVRFPLHSLIGLALQRVQGCNAPTRNPGIVTEREANRGVKL